MLNLDTKFMDKDDSIMLKVSLMKPDTSAKLELSGMFDTSSSVCIIKDAIAEELGLTIHSHVKLKRADGVVQVYCYYADVLLEGALFKDIMIIGLKDLNFDFVIGRNIITQCTTTMYPSEKGLTVNIRKKMDLF